MRVDNTTEPKSSTIVAPSDAVHLIQEPEPFVSRSGRKLAGALDEFGVDPTDAHCLDVGASTGGFTDCLLQRGAADVVALDVGYGQLHWRVRSDPRVTVVERTNFRHADPASIGAPFDLVVADVSFISLSLLAPRFRAVGADDASWVLLVKPQFEAGKGDVGKGGLVTDPDIHRTVLMSVVDAFSGVGLECQGLHVSSITGAKGNIEFVGWFRTEGPRVDRTVIDRVVGEAHS